MCRLLKKEEKLLKRLFSKRQQELNGYISSCEKRTNITVETAELLIGKHKRELTELKKLELKIIGESHE